MIGRYSKPVQKILIPLYSTRGAARWGERASRSFYSPSCPVPTPAHYSTRRAELRPVAVAIAFVVLCRPQPPRRSLTLCSSTTSPSSILQSSSSSLRPNSEVIFRRARTRSLTFSAPCECDSVRRTEIGSILLPSRSLHTCSRSSRRNQCRSRADSRICDL